MFLTKEKLNARVKELNSHYWNEGASYRWEYMSWVIEKLKKMGAESICEAGVSRMPLNDLSYIIEYPDYDLNKTPYSIKNRATGEVYDSPNNKIFDCFVALQVWEHLDKQEKAFREVMRISKSAILSFPYKWTSGDMRQRKIDEKVIAKWTCDVKPETVKII